MNNTQRCYCQETAFAPLFSVKEYTIVRCLSCSQVYTVTKKNARRVGFYSQSDIQVYLEKEQMFRALFRDVLSFIQRFVKKGILIEIGAGVGLLVDEARRAGFDAIGYEPSKAACRAAKRAFGVTLIQMPFRTLRKQKADVVVMNHVLEHIRDPHAIVSSVTSSLSPGGVFVVGVPNFGSVLARAKKGRWQSLIPDQHRWHFTLHTLDALVVPCGFLRVGVQSSNHDRHIHPLWKRPLYAILDTISTAMKNGEAILVAYQKL